MGNGFGPIRTTRYEDLAAFDALHPLWRRILRNSWANYAAVNFTQEIEEKFLLGKTTDQIAKNILRFHRSDKAAECLLTYGSAHPEAA